MENDHLLIGIGCNIMIAPDVPTTGSEAGRKATALIRHSTALQSLAEKKETDQFGENSRVSEEGSMAVAVDIANTFNDYIESQSQSQLYGSNTDSPLQVVQDFLENMDFSEQKLRDVEDEVIVQPLGLNEDGTLRVLYKHNGTEGTLVAEYLF